MRLTLSRRLTTPLIAVAAATGLVLGVSSGVAAADPPASSRSMQDQQLLLTKELVGSNVVYPGASVTYKTTLGYTTANGVGSAPLNQLSIPYVRDIPPAGWVSTAKTLTYPGNTTFAAQNGGWKATCSSGCTIVVGGYVIKSGQSAVLTTTYTVPANTPPGIYDSGAWSAKPNNWSGGERGSNTFGALVEVLDPNVTTTTTLNAPATADNGAAVDLVANVAPTPGGGTVQFKDGDDNIGAPVTVVDGTATLSHTFSTDGAHAITAVYSGATGFITSTSAPSTVEVSTPIADTTTTLTAPATADNGAAVDLVATVSPAPSGGTVQFKDGDDNIGGPVALTGDTATLSHTFTTDGAHAITAVYSGEGFFGASTSAVSTVAVSTPIADTTTTLTAPATADNGAAVDLTATVAPAPAGGTVQFKDGDDNLGGPVALTGDTATLSHTFTTDGAHAITAVYSGEGFFGASTSAVSTVAVSTPIADTTTTLTAPATADNGAAVDLTATVAPAPAGGTVQFKDGDDNLGGPVALTGDTATLSHTFTTDGAHAITAVYSGEGFFGASTSAVSTVAVSTPAPEDVATTTTLLVPASATEGQSIVLSTTVAPATAGGTVEFFDGTTAIGTATVTAGSATLAHTFTSTGAHSVKAVYSGAAGFLTSTSGTESVNVVPASPTDITTTLTLTAPGTATKDQAVTLKADVDPSAADGTVQFFDGATVIGTVTVTGGVANLQHTFTTTGAHSVHAVFTGAAGFSGSTSNTKAITVSDTTTPPTGGNGSFGG